MTRFIAGLGPFYIDEVGSQPAPVFDFEIADDGGGGVEDAASAFIGVFVAGARPAVFGVDHDAAPIGRIADPQEGAAIEALGASDIKIFRPGDIAVDISIDRLDHLLIVIIYMPLHPGNFI